MNFQNFFLILFFSSYVTGERNYVIQNGNIYFNAPDLSIDINKVNYMVQLQAYRYNINDKIIENGDSNQYSQLQWSSIGEPMLVKSKVQNKTEDIFQFTRDGFYIMVDMLTDAHRKVFRDIVQKKYQIDVETTQFVNLIPAVFDCTIKLVNNDGEDTILKGSAVGLETVPVKVKFEAKINSKERADFENIIGEDGDKLDFDINCDLESSDTVLKQSNLKISPKQISQFQFLNSIFGAANEVYVTRDQITSLALDIYSRLNIFEEFEISESQFTRDFIDDFVKQTALFGFRPVKIEDAISLLSNYSLNFDGNLNVSLVVEELGKLFKVIKVDNVEHITVDTDQYERVETLSKSDNGIGYIYNYILDKALTVYVHISNKREDWTLNDMEIDDELLEINRLSKNYIGWERQESRLVPKSLNVAKLSNVAFGKTLVFNRVKIEKYEPSFRKRISLNIKKTVEQHNLQNDKIDEKIRERIRIEMQMVKTEYQNAVSRLRNEFNEKIETHKEFINGTLFGMSQSHSNEKMEIEIKQIRNELQDAVEQVYRSFVNISDDAVKSQLQNHWPMNGHLGDVSGDVKMFCGNGVTFTHDRFGQSNSAIHFEGGYCQVPPGIYIHGEFTITTWIRFSKRRVPATILDFGATNDNQISLRVFEEPNGDFVFNLKYWTPYLPSQLGINSNEMFDKEYHSFRSVHLNQWYHIACVLKNTYVGFYINGELAAGQIQMQQAPGFAYMIPPPPRKMRQNNFIGKNFFGDISDMKIFRVGLSDKAIFNEYISNSTIL